MKNMMLIQDMYQNAPSFKMIPVSNECPFLEAAFNPHSKELIVRHRDKIPVFQLFDRLDQNGRPIPVTGKKTAEGEQAFKLQRIQYDGSVTYTLRHIEDVVRFMKRFLIEEDQPAVDVMFPVMSPELNAEMRVEEETDVDPTAYKSAEDSTEQ